mmetsp:Transcript_109714/g.315882  ORF Transcript_109714/g.315882 Transcript_109714/m.315882 type:complete len:691 (+) Transcript_109714:121-2193(+)
MGNRVKGREKKKSIKAASHSKMGSKRKLSRMGKKQKKNNAGLEATFVGRSKCLKMLQVTIKDFRRLCILKGIYPREPRGRVPGNKKGQTFYHIKDIRAIAHEPILEKFREFRAFMKKIRRAAGRNEKDEALRKNAICPTYTLHHLVRERYPRFLDALSDLDDALTLVYLFAALPTTTTIKSKVISSAKKLAAAWGAYCSTAACITKSFISVKGIYLEATIQSVAVRWIVPHSFTQFMPEDVDYRVMTTFFEFYETLLHFVLFKLYSDLGVRYPLQTLDSNGEVKGSTAHILGANLRNLKNALDTSSSAITKVVSEAVEDDSEKPTDVVKKSKSEKKKEKALVKSVGAALNSIEDDSDDDDDDEDGDDIDVSGPLKAALESMANDEARSTIPGGAAMVDDDAVKRRRLFAGLTFFLAREVPRGYIELVCLAYGGKVGWEGLNSPIAENDPSITHHIVDRPRLPSSYDALPKSREFVQPQWVLDCSNFMFLLPVAKYAVGVTLPPHLSPWVDHEEEGYKPAYAEEIERLKTGDVNVTTSDDKDFEEIDNGDGVASDDDMGGENDDNDDNQDETDADEDDDEDDSESKDERIARRRQREEEEAHALAKTMMSRKASHLYGRMQHGINQKKAQVEALKSRRRDIEHTKKKDDTGKTPLKKKVERLKKERSALEKEYSNTGGTMKKSKKMRRSES